MNNQSPLSFEERARAQKMVDILVPELDRDSKNEEWFSETINEFRDSDAKFFAALHLLKCASLSAPNPPRLNVIRDVFLHTNIFSLTPLTHELSLHNSFIYWILVKCPILPTIINDNQLLKALQEISPNQFHLDEIGKRDLAVLFDATIAYGSCRNIQVLLPFSNKLSDIDVVHLVNGVRKVSLTNLVNIVVNVSKSLSLQWAHVYDVENCQKLLLESIPLDLLARSVIGQGGSIIPSWIDKAQILYDNARQKSQDVITKETSNIALVKLEQMVCMMCSKFAFNTSGEGLRQWLLILSCSRKMNIFDIVLSNSHPINRQGTRELVIFLTKGKTFQELMSAESMPTTLAAKQKVFDLMCIPTNTSGIENGLFEWMWRFAVDCRMSERLPDLVQTAQMTLSVINLSPLVSIFI